MFQQQQNHLNQQIQHQFSLSSAINYQQNFQYQQQQHQQQQQVVEQNTYYEPMQTYHNYNPSEEDQTTNTSSSIKNSSDNEDEGVDAGGSRVEEIMRRYVGNVAQNNNLNRVNILNESKVVTNINKTNASNRNENEEVKHSDISIRVFVYVRTLNRQYSLMLNKIKHRMNHQSFLMEICQRLGIGYDPNTMILYLPPNHQIMDLEPVEKNDLLILGFKKDIKLFTQQYDVNQLIFKSYRQEQEQQAQQQIEQSQQEKQAENPQAEKAINNNNNIQTLIN
ncbi:UNKNOWN [Stylonychia lemnae]|uniref:Uncharacterized protein n=1 Tax=Stylonychia lemnae TaxID=5949 RepID=A0A077ZU74_STYLE|nr:UNKNOWN [Stylonychia lemnae]|eukprot:CDW73458.1 UNKNOWN [Stylonychia lemnae]